MLWKINAYASVIWPLQDYSAYEDCLAPESTLVGMLEIGICDKELIFSESDNGGIATALSLIHI